MARGNHIRTRRWGYWHHGIDCGDGTVIHYTGTPFRLRHAKIERCSMEQFLQGHQPEVILHDTKVDPDEIVQRAESRMGECKYSLIRCNCEHFASWCAAGKQESHQVTKAVKAVVFCGVVATVTAAAMATVAAHEIMRRREASGA